MEEENSTNNYTTTTTATEQGKVPTATTTTTNNVTNTTSASSSSSSRPLVIHPPYNGPLAKVYNYYNTELPCFPSAKKSSDAMTRERPYAYPLGQSKNGWKGMYYTKISKCSSSTLAGVAVQIARNHGKRRYQQRVVVVNDTQVVGDPNKTTSSQDDHDDDNNECYVNADHGMYHHLMNRDKSQSMLWTFLREPAKRQVSDFYHFHVSRRYVIANDDNMRKHALRGLNMSKYMTGGVFSTISGRQQYDTPEKQVAFIMDKYDFIGLVERYHESLILLKLVFGLDLRDLLYTSAKRSGGYDDGEFRKECFMIQKSHVSDNMKEWFRTSEEWYNYSKTDILLFRVVNKSLDLTVEAFGKERVAKEVERYERALIYADEQCGDTVVYPCSPEGVLIQPENTTCVAHDWACAHKCLETLDLSQFY